MAEGGVVTYDLVVVGGGLAGCLAAVAAARRGVPTALIHNRPSLGGNASKEVRVPVLGAGGGENSCYFRETGLVGELLIENLYRNPEGNPELWDTVLIGAVCEQPGLDVYLNTHVHRVRMAEAEVIGEVEAITLGSEREYRFRAEYFADCTGDGYVGALAGAPFDRGREAAGEHGETLAPPSRESGVLGSTIMFQTRDAGAPVRFIPPSWAHRFAAESFRGGRDPLREFDPGAPFHWWVEYGGHLDTIGDNEAIRYELLKIVYGIWDYLKNSPEAGDRFRNLTLEWVGAIPGKRESRRLLGTRLLTERDILEQTPHADTVAYGGWSLDDHAPLGFYDEGPGTRFFHIPGLYGIPLGCLCSSGVRNLLFAGRDASFSHVALSSARVIATCGLMGEAVGTAVAHSLRAAKPPRELSPTDVAALQQDLLRADGYLPGVTCEGLRPDRVTASSYLSSPALDEPDAVRRLGRALLMFPVATPELEAVDLLLEAAGADAEISYALHRGDERGNYFPAARLGEGQVTLPAGGPRWVSLPLSFPLEGPGWHFLEVSAEAPIGFHTSSRKLVGVNAWAYRGTESGPSPGRSFRFINRYSPWERLNGIWRTRHETFCFRLTPSQPVYLPENVADGHLRPFHLPRLWVSAPSDFREPEWLRLEWDRRVEIGEVHLYLDVDLDYHLRSIGASYPFRAFPECVRDYALVGELADGTERALARVTGNYQRHRVHPVEGGSLRALRLEVEATNGSPCAHVYAITAY